jgi:hypothetical protein
MRKILIIIGVIITYIALCVIGGFIGALLFSAIFDR